MENVPDSMTPRPTSRLKLWIAVPVVFIGVIIGLLLWGIIRGNWADAQLRNPASAADGVVTQLLRTSAGDKQIRAAVLVQAPPENVWKVVTDYNHFSEIFPNISSAKGTQEADGRWHLVGEVHSIIGHWPMDLHVRHEQAAGKFVASWDEPNQTWKVNHGSWVIVPHGNSESLLEYNLQLKVSPFPDFAVRAVLLDQLKPVLKAVVKRAQENQPPR